MRDFIEWICHLKSVPRNTVSLLSTNKCLSMVKQDALCQIQNTALQALGSVQVLHWQVCPNLGPPVKARLVQQVLTH